MRKIIIALHILTSMICCEKEKTQAEKDEEIIKNYLSENNIEAKAYDHGLYYIITEEGSGGHPDLSSTVEVRYKGYLTDNRVFDETSGDNSIEFPLSDLISGWQVGIPLLRRGGKGTFFIPSALGYGPYQAGSIPLNSVLIFEIELVDFY